MQKKIDFTIRSFSMRIFAFILPVSFLFFSLASFAGDKINFSGEWTMNEDKSDLGDNQFNVIGAKITIEQKDNEFSIVRFSQNPEGDEFTIKEKYTLDGKECENTVFNSPKKSTATWSEDGKSLTITSTILFNRDGEQMEIKSTEIWKLTEDGNSISIDLASTSSMGELKQLYIFDKAKPKPTPTQ